MDHTKYINTYIDVAMTTINEHTSQLLQLKTQNRIANDLLIEKDNLFAIKEKEVESLRQEISNLSNSVSDLHNVRTDNDQLKQQHVGFLNKISHMETMSKQIVDMKQQILNYINETESLKLTICDKDVVIENLQKQIVDMKQQILNYINETESLKLTICDKDVVIENLQKQIVEMTSHSTKQDQLNKKSMKKSELSATIAGANVVKNISTRPENKLVDDF